MAACPPPPKYATADCIATSFPPRFFNVPPFPAIFVFHRSGTHAQTFFHCVVYVTCYIVYIMQLTCKPRKGQKPCLTFYPTDDWELAFHLYIEFTGINWLPTIFIAFVLGFDSAITWLLFRRLYFSLLEILNILDILCGQSCFKALFTTFMVCCSLRWPRVSQFNFVNISLELISYESPVMTLAALFWSLCILSDNELLQFPADKWAVIEMR